MKILIYYITYFFDLKLYAGIKISCNIRVLIGHCFPFYILGIPDRTHAPIT